MSPDERIYSVGLAGHTVAAVLGVVGAAVNAMPPASGCGLSTLAMWALSLAMVGCFGLFLGFLSGGWALILVGRTDRLHRAWVALSSGLTLGLVHQVSFLAIASR